MLPLALLVAGCGLRGPGGKASIKPPSELSPDTATSWFTLILRLAKETPGFSPPVASRAIGYTGVTLYEAIVPSMPGYKSLAGQLNGLAPLPQRTPGAVYDEETVANAAVATIVRYLFNSPGEVNRLAIETLDQALADRARARLQQDVFDRSVTQGRAVATAIFRWSTLDGSYMGEMRNFPTTWKPPVGPGLWVQTPRKPASTGVTPKPQTALQPDWGTNRTFLPADPANTCAAPPPLPYSETKGSSFYQDALEVYDTLRNLTPEQREIALFWSDAAGSTATPGGHSVSIATQAIQAKDATLDVAAETYAEVGIAVADAFIACWQTKYQYDRIRPISYIQKVIDPRWDTPVVTDPVETPPFPEYTSGHSVQSAAVAEVLTAIFGEFPFTDHTEDGRGMPARSFASFKAAAAEAGISRLYGGIHFRNAIENGLAQGACIGQRVNGLDLHEGQGARQS